MGSTETRIHPYRLLCAGCSQIKVNKQFCKSGIAWGLKISAQLRVYFLLLPVLHRCGKQRLQNTLLAFVKLPSQENRHVNNVIPFRSSHRLSRARFTAIFTSAIVRAQPPIHPLINFVSPKLVSLLFVIFRPLFVIFLGKPSVCYIPCHCVICIVTSLVVV